MCNCAKGKKQASGVTLQRAIQTSNGTNWVNVRYYNPSATTPIRVFDFVESPTKFVGLAQHGSYLSVPPYAVDIDRSDGSRFVLPENFDQPVSFAVTAEDKAVAEKPAPKVTRKRLAR